MHKKILIIHNPSIGSDNIGDDIIMEYCNEVITECFPSSEYKRIDLPTHLPVKEKYKRVMDKANYQLVCGTNILCPHIEKYNLWKMNGGVDLSAYKNIILLACGWNSYSDDVSEESLKLYNSILSKECIHSVRDHYTEEWMKKMGFSNVVNTNCITLWNRSGDNKDYLFEKKSTSVVFSLTAHRKNIQRDVFFINLLISNYEKIYFWPQGDKDLDYLKTLMPKLTNGRCIRVLKRSLKAYERLIDKNDIDYIGTRLHGGIHAFNKGIRTIIIAVDNRASEIGKDTGLTVVRNDEVEQKLSQLINSKIDVHLNIQSDNINTWKKQFD